MFLIAKEHDYQRQVDRACAAQSEALLPPPEVEIEELRAAKERIERFKNHGVQV